MTFVTSLRLYALQASARIAKNFTLFRGEDDSYRTDGEKESTKSLVVDEHYEPVYNISNKYNFTIDISCRILCDLYKSSRGDLKKSTDFLCIKYFNVLRLILPTQHVDNLRTRS